MSNLEQKFLPKVICCIVYLSISILYFAMDNSPVVSKVLLAFFILVALIVIVESKLISLGKLFAINFLALNLASIIYFTFLDSTGYKYLLITHCSFALFSITYITLSIRDEAKREFIVYEALNDLLITRKTLYLLYTPVVISIFLMLFKFGPSSLIDISTHTRTETKEASGFTWILSKYLLMMYLPCSFIQGFKLFSANRTDKLINISIFFVVMVIIFLFLRTRTYLLGPIVTLFLGYFFSMLGSRGDKIKINFSQYFKVIIISFIVISLAASVRFIRGIIEVGEGSLNFQLIAEKTLIEGDLGYGHIINKVIDYSEENEIKLNGQSYYRLIFAAIPRAIYPDKPENTQRIVGMWLYPGSTYMTVPPGIQGDTYINFGVFGVFIFIFYGAAFRFIDGRDSKYIIIFTASSFMPMFHLTRGGFTNPIIIFLFTLVFSMIVTTLISKKKNDIQ